MADLIGQQISNYQIQALLGSGAFADVYIGTHIYLGNYAAIKVLRTKLIGEEHDSFVQEARILTQLVHPHIVRMLEFGVEQEEVFYLIMEYAPNGTLRQRQTISQNGRQVATTIPLATVVEYVKQVASALQYAHNQRCIHRDLKPENILINSNDQLIVSDFGLARTYRATFKSLDVLQSEHISGTPTYMAPEQFDGRTQFASDQYSLAVMVYEWLAGRPPFRGNIWELVGQHINASTPPSLHAMNASIPVAVENVVFKAMSKDPHDRFPNVRAFAQAFEQAAHDIPFETQQAFPMTNQPKDTLVPPPTVIRAAPEQEQLLFPEPYFANDAFITTIKSVPTPPKNISSQHGYQVNISASQPSPQTSFVANTPPVQTRPTKKRLSLIFLAVVIAIILTASTGSVIAFFHPFNNPDSSQKPQTAPITGVSTPTDIVPTSTDAALTSISDVPVGKTIWLKANINGDYISAWLDEANVPLEARSTHIEAWEEFDVVDEGNGEIALKAHANGDYVSAWQSDTNTPLEARSTEVQGWEIFRWVDLGNNTIALVSHNGDYVSAWLSEANVPLEVRSPYLKSWEIFQWGLV
jgi:serine/threonine protein kinase